jgi:hypothetical protein
MPARSNGCLISKRIYPKKRLTGCLLLLPALPAGNGCHNQVPLTRKAKTQTRIHAAHGTASFFLKKTGKPCNLLGYFHSFLVKALVCRTT